MIKHVVKSLARKTARVSMGVDLPSELGLLKNKLAAIESNVSQLTNSTFLIKELETKLGQVENYQPVYGLRGLVESPQRGTEDRCNLILEYLGDVSGMRILDVGSSLGYVSFFFADRGAMVQGWEASPQNAEVARLIGSINGVPVEFKTKELTLETAGSVAHDENDVVIVLSVFHHIIRFQGLEATKKIVRQLLDKVPVMVVELAKKGEDSSLPWDKSQPDDELAIFEGLDVKITKIGSFGNHLSTKKRPLYIIEREKMVEVKNKKYLFDTTSTAAYSNSPLRKSRSTHRKYYFSNKYIIKEYGLQRLDEKLFNVPEANTEIATLTALTKLKKARQLEQDFPVLVDAEVSPKQSKIVIQRQPGELLSALSDKLSVPEKERVTQLVIKKVLAQLAELRNLGLHHNDVRSWNIIADVKGGKVLLIDYANVSNVPEQDDVLQLLWAISCFMQNNREVAGSKTEMPERSVFTSNKSALTLFDLLKTGESDPSTVLKKLKI